MLAARPWPRTRMWTFDACCARNTAACPAELPPPTSATSAFAHIFASSADAQYQTPRPSNSFRRGTSGRGESRRACAHDSDVEERVVIRGVENAEAARQRVFRRIEEHFAVGAQRQYVGHHRTILGQQCRSGIVLCRVDHLMWMTVAA